MGTALSPYGPIRALEPAVASRLRAHSLPASRRQCTHGRQVRDFLYVEDAADAFVKLLDHQAQGPFNIASGVPTRARRCRVWLAIGWAVRALTQLGARSPTRAHVMVADIVESAGPSAGHPAIHSSRDWISRRTGGRTVFARVQDEASRLLSGLLFVRGVRIRRAHRRAGPSASDLCNGRDSPARHKRRPGARVLSALRFCVQRGVRPGKLNYGAGYDNTQDHSPAFKAHVDGLVERLARTVGMNNARKWSKSVAARARFSGHSSAPVRAASATASIPVFGGTPTALTRRLCSNGGSTALIAALLSLTSSSADMSSSTCPLTSPARGD